MSYRLWCKAKTGLGVGFWSGSRPEKFSDRSSAQSVADKLNSEEVHLNTYEVARINADGGPSFFDIKDPVEDLEPLTDSEDFDLDEPIPYTLRSPIYQTILFGADPATPDSEPSPDAKRFVTIEDLRATANKNMSQSHEWRVGCLQVNVEQSTIFVNGSRVTTEQAAAMALVFSDALKATAA